MRLSLTFLILLASITACAIEPPLQPVRVDIHGAAIDGYSPVSYFTVGEPRIGDPAYASSFQGVSYWMASLEEQELFESDPAKYIPAHGGWCTLMMGGSGRRTPGHPESWAIVDDRLMLFWSGDTPETKGMGMSNWISNTGGTEEGALEVVAKADLNWTRFVSGDRRSPIFLYKERDKQSVTPEQLADATVNLVE